MSGMIVTRINIERSALFELHAWLDATAPGWKYFTTRMTSDELRTRNESFVQECFENGTAHKKSGVYVVFPDKTSRMLAKLSWEVTEIVKD